MKTNRLILALFALMLALPLLVMTSCSEEDAPEFSHSLNDLNGSWVWETTSGDFADAFDVTIAVESDTKFVINNFLNLGNIPVTVSGTSLSFSGEFADGSKVQAGTGTISNGWETMTISFDYFDGEDTQKGSASLNKGKLPTKKSLVKDK